MSRAFKTFITLVPVIALFVVTAALVYSNHFNDEYLAIYALLSDTVGFGLFWLPVYYYMAYRYNLCHYTKVALVGLTSYSLLNISYDISVLFGLGFENNEYVNWFEEAALSAFIALTIIYIFHNPNGNNPNS